MTGDAAFGAASRKTARVAAVGLGYFSRFHYDGWRRLSGCDLAAVCGRDADEARVGAEREGAPRWFDDVETMLEAVDPDIFDIITPPETHAAFIRAALRPGRVVICQKPFCDSLETARAVAQAAEAAGATLVVHENFRFQPWHRSIKARLEDGALGAVHQASLRFRPGDGRGADAYLERQPYFQTMPRFLVRETLVHFIDVFRYLFGPVETVYADLRRMNPAIAGEDAGYMILTHASGARSLIDGSRYDDHVAENRRFTFGDLLVEGETGALRLDGDGGLYFRAFGANSERWLNYPLPADGFAGDCVTALQRHVLAHLQDGAPLENRASDYLANLEIQETAYRSAEIGAKLPVSAQGPGVESGLGRGVESGEGSET